VDGTRIARRWRSLRGGVDWALAALLAAVGLADVIHTRFAEPLWAGIVATLLVFLPLGLRRRFPLAVLATVAAASLVLELALGNPADAKQYSFEVFVAWLVVAYSTATHTDGRRSRIAVLIGAATLIAWLAWSYAAGADDQNTVPSAFFAAVAWLAGRAMRRRQQLVELLGDRAEQLEREREERVRAMVADERGRIARELHDVVAHSVSVMVVQAQAGPRLGDREQATAAFEAIAASGREALVELRRLLGILRTDDEQLAIGPQPGLASLAGLIEQMGEAGLAVELRIEGEQVPLPPGVDLSAYRIVQEALTNTLRHAGHARARVEVHYRPGGVELEIADDGLGAPTTVNGSGHGLIGMRERTALYGGSLDAGPRPGGGFAVRAQLPLPRSRR
jgi:signal transduction histidine kinase